MFSTGSSSSTSFATVTPSFTIRGDPYLLSRTTFRPCTNTFTHIGEDRCRVRSIHFQAVPHMAFKQCHTWPSNTPNINFNPISMRRCHSDLSQTYSKHCMKGCMHTLGPSVTPTTLASLSTPACILFNASPFLLKCSCFAIACVTTAPRRLQFVESEYLSESI